MDPEPAIDRAAKRERPPQGELSQLSRMLTREEIYPFAEGSDGDKLAKRVAAGIEWIRDHDPEGAFHVWFISGISPSSPLPAHEDSRREDYAAYHRNRRLLEELDKRYLAAEAAARRS
jgi:hypothetical protein